MLERQEGMRNVQLRTGELLDANEEVRKDTDECQADERCRCITSTHVTGLIGRKS